MVKRRGSNSVRNTTDEARLLDAAIKELLAATVDRVLEAGLTHKQVNARSREQAEIQQMLARLRSEVAKSGRGWTWHLLRVLDWDALDLFANEGAMTATQRRTWERRWRARGRRLSAASAAFEAAFDDLTWFAQRHEGRPAQAKMIDVVASGRSVVRQAADTFRKLNRQLAQLSKIHGRVRRYEHVRAAALRILLAIKRFEGSGALAKLASFIEDANETLKPRPCPMFADDGAYDRVRQILSRSGL